MGFAKKILIPRLIMTIPPSIWKFNCCSLRKFIIKEIPRPAIKAKIVSAVAIPIPDKKPEVRPLLIVLWIHNMPNGPIGIDITNPMINPLINKLSSIINNTASFQALLLKNSEKVTLF